MKITVKNVLKKRPCGAWDKTRITKYIGAGKTFAEILSLRGVPVDDKIWCVTRFLPDKSNRDFALWCVRRCKNDCVEITEYLNVIERFYGEKATEDELCSAKKAAYSAADRSDYWAAYSAADKAACKAAYWAAYRAAYSAAYSAADKAAYSAADKAAYSAACKAAYWATYKAAYSAKERQTQLRKLKSIVKVYEGDV